MPPIEMGTHDHIYIIIFIVGGLSLLVSANVFVAYKVARRVGLGKRGSSLTGLVSGIISTFSFLFIGAPLLGYLLTFLISGILAWLIAIWARMPGPESR